MVVPWKRLRRPFPNPHHSRRVRSERNRRVEREERCSNEYLSSVSPNPYNFLYFLWESHFDLRACFQERNYRVNRVVAVHWKIDYITFSYMIKWRHVFEPGTFWKLGELLVIVLAKYSRGSKFNSICRKYCKARNNRSVRENGRILCRRSPCS
jgi:hypothetical protein